jgi:P4 family phage/plasmid primase-like protien
LSGCRPGAGRDLVGAIVDAVRAAGPGDDVAAKQARQDKAASADVLEQIASIAEGSPDGLRLRRELAPLGISAGALKASLKWHRDQVKAREPRREQRRREVDPELHAFERGDQSELATATLEALGPEPLTFDAGEFFRYAPALGIWELVPGYVVRSTAERFAGCPVGDKGDALKIAAATTLGVEALAKDRLQSIPDRVTFTGAPPGIAFRNGFVTVTEGRIEHLEHDLEHRARFAYPFDYQPEAPSPKLDLFLEQLFADVDKYERDLRIMLLQEFIGACLVGEATRYQRYLVLFATGGNGKSELLKIARGIFPPDAVTSLPPQKWGDQFKAIMLEGKRANFCDELPDGEIMSGDSVKMVVTGEPVTGERKHRDPVTFKPIAGHILATNSPIRSTDQSVGFWRRPVVLPLTRKFDGAPERILEAGQAVLDAELPGVVTWALYGAARAQVQMGYTMPPSSSAVLSEWRDESDQVRGFAAEQPIVEREQAALLYNRYKEWAKVNGIGAMSSTMFGRRIMSAGLYDREGKDVRYYVRRQA